MKAPLFLKAKHWQIFVPAIAIPFVTMIVFMIVVVSMVVSSGQSGPEDMMWVNYFTPVIFVLCAGTQFLWMWNVAVNLRKFILCEERKPRVNLFRITFFFPLVYFSLFPLMMSNFMSGVSLGQKPDPSQFLAIFLFGMIGYLVMIFCLLNNNYVVAKTIKMTELQRKVTFGDFVGDFFFLLIFPVAIWFLQPRINRIVNGEAVDPQVRFVAPEKDLLD